MAEPRTFVIGFPQDNMANDWRRAQVMAVKTELARYQNISFIYSDAKGDITQNIQDIENMADNGVDLLIINPRDTVAMTPVIRKVRAQGIPVVLLTQRILTDDYTTFISPSDDKIARQAAAYMAKKLRGEGNILILQGPLSSSSSAKRTVGFLEEIAKHEDINVVALTTAINRRPDALQAVESALSSGLTIDAIFAQDDRMIAGAMMALKAAKINPKDMLIVGIGYIPESRAAIRSGNQDAAFTYPTSGKEGAQIAVQILLGNRVARDMEVPFEMITRSNVERVDPVF